MAVTMLVIPSAYPNGVAIDSRNTIVKGQLLPYNSSNSLYTISAFSITSNVVTFTTSTNTLTGGGGDVVLVAGFEGALAYLNGGYTTASATSTTFTASLTHANVPTTSAKALATLSPNYATGGLALGAFTGLNGLPTPVGTIGPKDYPNWIEVASLLGTRQYPVNSTVQPALVLSYTLAGVQATNGSAIPSDVIGFEAEYVKNAY